MANRYLLVALACTALLCATAARAEEEKKLGQYSGWEGREEVIGAAVARTIRDASPPGDPRYDLQGREKELGLWVSTAIKTMNVKKPYQHEINDALVKMTLQYVQFAKDHNLLDDLIANEVHAQRPMVERVARQVQKTGNRELVLISLTEQTACFYQLVPDFTHTPGKVTYHSPYGRVLAASAPLKQFTITEKDVHEMFTIPRIRALSKVYGVEIEVSPWREDGMITLSIAPERVASN
jgi:hypothetical protein